MRLTTLALAATLACSPDPFELGMDESAFPDVDTLPVGKPDLLDWVADVIKAAGYRHRQGVLADRSWTDPITKTITACPGCGAGDAIWLKTHEVGHVFQFGHGYTLLDYADPTMRLGMEFQAVRFQMKLCGRASIYPQEWHQAAMRQIDDASQWVEVSDRERQAVSDQLWVDFHDYNRGRE